MWAYLITGSALALSLIHGRCTVLQMMLLASWAGGIVLSMAGVDMAATVFALATADMILALASVAILSVDNARSDARMVGLLSIALFPAHWAMSASSGAASWPIYAGCVNAVFVAQCIIVGGFMDGMVARFDSFLVRVRLVHPYGNRAR